MERHPDFSELLLLVMLFAEQLLLEKPKQGKFPHRGSGTFHVKFRRKKRTFLIASWASGKPSWL